MTMNGERKLCGYCGTVNVDHAHTDGTDCCGDCCATHGGLAHADPAAYKLMDLMHERIRLLVPERWVKVTPETMPPDPWGEKI